MHKHGLCRHAVSVCVCVSVCVSVTFVNCVKTNKRMPSKFFHHRVDKLLLHPHLDLDQQQKSVTSRRSPLAHAHHVSSTSVTVFVRYLAQIEQTTEWQNEPSHNSASLGAVTTEQFYSTKRVLSNTTLFQYKLKKLNIFWTYTFNSSFWKSSSPIHFISIQLIFGEIWHKDSAINTLQQFTILQPWARAAD